MYSRYRKYGGPSSESIFIGVFPIVFIIFYVEKISKIWAKNEEILQLIGNLFLNSWSGSLFKIGGQHNSKTENLRNFKFLII